jgi:hypothetical protein
LRGGRWISPRPVPPWWRPDPATCTCTVIGP